MPFYTKKAILWGFDAGDNKACLGFRLKFPKIFPDFN